MIYLLVVTLTMLVLPVGSIIAQLGAAPLLLLLGKWFVFWAVGVRLLLAGVRQYVQPAFTSNDILGINDSKAFVLVRELGGANIATGVVGVTSMALPTFVLPTAISAGIFYVVAAIEHLKERHRDRNETVALVSDVWAAFVLLGFASATFHPRPRTHLS